MDVNVQNLGTPKCMIFVIPSQERVRRTAHPFWQLLELFSLGLQAQKNQQSAQPFQIHCTYVFSIPSSPTRCSTVPFDFEFRPIFQEAYFHSLVRNPIRKMSGNQAEQLPKQADLLYLIFKYLETVPGFDATSVALRDDIVSQT